MATVQDTSTQKATLPLASLKHALKIASAVIERKTTIPVLQCVRLDHSAAGLSVESTNMDVYMRVTMPLGTGPEKPIVLPAEKFTAWTKLLSGEDVKLSTTASRATVQCGRAKAVLPVSSAATWPSVETTLDMRADGVTLTQGSFARALRMAMLAVSEEESRYTMTAVQAQSNGETLRLVATDGYRLMVYSIPCDEKVDILLPANFVRVLLPLLTDEDGGVDLSYNEHAILAAIDADEKIRIAGLRIQGAFPNWEGAFPKEERTHVTVNAEDLTLSLERALLLADEKSTAIDLTFGEAITLNAASASEGESTEVVPCTGGPEKPIKFRVNGQYLAPVLRKLSGEISMALPAANRALLINSNPYDGETLGYVVMPMQG